MKKILILLVVFSFGSILNAQSDDKAISIVKKSTEKMKSLTSAKIDFTMTISGGGANDTKKGTAKIKGDKYAVDLGEYKIFNNGIKKWVYNGSVCTKCDASEDEEDDMLNPNKLFANWESGYKYKYVKQLTLNGKKVHLVKLYPEDAQNAEFHTVDLYIDVTTSEIRKVVIVSKEQTTTSIVLDKLIKNPSLNDSEFVFNKAKYPNVEIIDC